MNLYQTPQEVVLFAAKEIKSGRSYSETRDMLIDQGVERPFAQEIVDRIREARANQTYEDHGSSDSNADVLWGIVWLGGGLMLSLSGVGYVFIGAIVYGAARLIKGIVS